MLKYVLAGFTALTIASFAFGQQLPQETQQSPSETKPYNVQRAEFALQQLSDQIKSMDEATLRILIRLQLITFLWNKLKSDVDATAKAAIVAKEAMDDLEAHEKELPALYAKSFRRDLLALLKLHAPNLAARLVEQDKTEQEKNRTQFEVAYSMLDSKNGIEPAAEMVRRSLNSGQDPKGMLIFFLGRLERENSPLLPVLLTEIVSIEERKPGLIAVDSLLQIIRFYLKDDTPPELKTRYFAAVIRTVELNHNKFDENLMRSSYGVLNNVILPRVETLSPSLYPRTFNLISTLTHRIPQSMNDQIAAKSRINNSTDRLNQLIIEANNTKDKAFKESLLNQAAQLALEKGELKLAVEIVPASSDDSNYGLWRDQFLNDVVSSALRQKDAVLAGFASSKINSPLNRALAIEKIALFHFEGKDLIYAQQWLNDAVKLIEKSENKADKAIAYLQIIPSVMKVDESRVVEMIQAAIKAANDIPKPKIDEKSDSPIRQAYAKTLAHIALNVISVFRSIAPKDEPGTLSLANEIQHQELRAFAAFGAYTGIISQHTKLRPQK